MNWKGVMPAITTSFTEDLDIDHIFMAATLPVVAREWLRGHRCAGLVG